MYDSKCYELAVAFLEDHPNLDTEEHRQELAEEIQETVEGYLSEVSDDPQA